MSDRPSGVVPVEPIFDWEGPAINNPESSGARTGESSYPKTCTFEGAALSLLFAAASAPAEDRSKDALKGKVVAHLAGWRDMHGQEKLEELRQLVLNEIANRAINPQQGEALKQSVNNLFDRAKQ